MVAADALQPHSAEDEPLKRNTDCIYFLASPLTCKKGNECEYRHSDTARLNPRDCWFWLNGNCLNPKCAFRHPPLDGLLGTQTRTAHVENASNKSVVPCKFFQSGFCLRGDWCPFLHAPNSMQTKALSDVEPSTSKKVVVSVHEKEVPPTNKSTPITYPPADSQVAGELESATDRNGFSTIKRITSSINELPHYISVPVSYKNLAGWSNCVHHPHLDEPGTEDTMDAGDNSREPSPGFDVLVDDEVRDSNFNHSEFHYRRSRKYEAGNEYDINNLTDYNMIADNGRRNDSIGIGYHHLGYFGLEQNRGSSIRTSRRRSCDRDNFCGEVDDELDLRHGLARSKPSDGLMYAINDVKDRSYQGLRRHKGHVFSSRLQGRIRLPQRSSSPTGISCEGRIRARVKGRVKEASSNGWKKHRMRRGTVSNNNNGDFESPKSLAELKKRKKC